MAKKINHIKPSFIEGGEVWHDIDKFPMLDHTILVELQVKGSDGLIYRTQDVVTFPDFSRHFFTL